MGHPEVGGASCLAKHESRTCFFSVSTGVADPQGMKRALFLFRKPPELCQRDGASQESGDTPEFLFRGPNTNAFGGVPITRGRDNIFPGGGFLTVLYPYETHPYAAAVPKMVRLAPLVGL
jgi:hypothetical protein